MVAGITHQGGGNIIGVWCNARGRGDIAGSRLGLGCPDRSQGYSRHRRRRSIMVAAALLLRTDPARLYGY